MIKKITLIALTFAILLTGCANKHLAKADVQAEMLKYAEDRYPEYYFSVVEFASMDSKDELILEAKTNPKETGTKALVIRTNTGNMDMEIS